MERFSYSPALIGSCNLFGGKTSSYVKAEMKFRGREGAAAVGSAGSTTLDDVRRAIL